MKPENECVGTDYGDGKQLNRRKFLRAGTVVLGVGCLTIPPVWRMLLRAKTPQVIAKCQGPFRKGERVEFADVEIVNSDSGIVSPKTIRLIDRQTHCSSELVFQFVGDPQPAPNVKVVVVFFGSKGQVIHRQSLMCSDGRSNATPVYMFGREMFGSPDNIENFRVPFGIEDVDRLEVQFNRI